MADRSELLMDLLKDSSRTGWPSASDFETNLFISPPLAEKVHSCLEEHRWCALVGPPRSGKTTLARFIGLETVRKRPGGLLSKGSGVLHLDLTSIADIRDDIQSLLLDPDPESLFIIDNWHARPDCHDELLERLEAEWTGGKVLVVITQSGVEDELSSIPKLLEKLTKQDKSAFTIDTTGMRSELANAMVDKKLESYIGDKSQVSNNRIDLLSYSASMGLHVDEEDYVQALSAPAKYKKLRGNLRFLSWRLSAWDPAVCHLREVPLENVLNEVERQITGPARPYARTLAKIAVVAQWEIPYRWSPRENEPAGIGQLERRNLVIPVEPGISWFMDTTDAYLSMYKMVGEQWLSETVTLLGEYLQLLAYPTYTFNVIFGVLRSDAYPDTKTEIICGLFENRAVLEQERDHLAQRASEGEPTYSFLVNLIKIILRAFPDNEKQANDRLAMVAYILTREMAELCGIAARSVSTTASMWFLRTMVLKDRERFREFGKTFLDTYGEDNLRLAINDAPSGKMQRSWLQTIAYYDPHLRDTLSTQIQRMPLYTNSIYEIPIDNLPHWLLVGTVQKSRYARTRKTQLLAEIDEHFILQASTDDPHTAHHIQLLLNSALWLSPNDASRIASLVPLTLPRQLMKGVAVRDLTYLVRNSWSADKIVGTDATEDIIDLLLSMPLHVIVPLERATRIGRLLSTIEKVRPGVVQEWCRDEVNYLSDLVLSLEDEEAIDDLFVPLAAFASAVMSDVIVNLSEQAKRILLDGRPLYGGWPRCGILALSCELWREVSWDAVPNDQELSSTGSILLIFAIYGLQRCLSHEHVSSLMRRIAALSEARSSVPLQVIALHLGRHQLPWERDQVISMATTILRASKDPRTDALNNIVIAGTMLPSLKWNMEEDLDAYNNSHRALSTAIHEDILTIEHANRAVLNEQHPFVETSLSLLEQILAPIRHHSLNLAEWDARLNRVISPTELYYWRSKLLISGIVNSSMNPHANSVEVQFSYAGPNKELLDNLIGLPS